MPLITARLVVYNSPLNLRSPKSGSESDESAASYLDQTVTDVHYWELSFGDEFGLRVVRIAIYEKKIEK